MDKSIFNLDKIKNLSKESKAKIEKENHALILGSGALIEILEVHNDLIKVQVKNVNGQRAAKHKLLANVYKILNNNLPSGYRVSIKL